MTAAPAANEGTNWSALGVGLAGLVNVILAKELTTASPRPRLPICTVTVCCPEALVPQGLSAAAAAGAKTETRSGGTGAAWVTVNVTPPITSVPVRDGPFTFGAATYCTDAGPVPLGGVTVSQLANDCAVQGHVGSVPITIWPVPPAAGTDALV